MSKSTKKWQSVRENDSCASDSDDYDDRVHNRFLRKIKQFEGKPKITPATRNEPAAEVSEFNLPSKNKSDTGKPSFRKEDLLRPLKSKNVKLAQKLEAVKKTTALPKPLETVFEKKIQREVGYEKTKKHLDRWKDLVESNRVADQLRFPLKNRKIEIFDHTDDDLFSSLSNPTLLEKELSAVLNSSDVAKEDKEKMAHSKFRTTLNDILAKRKMMANVRAKASYAVAKARRQNKIKSKKYHRLLRSEKTKQQIKDFETLQKTDPEAALKQLEMLEKNRAEERATLRHRNTGKWARNQVIKAKYNKESRVALSEQLSKNRELTQKLTVEGSDDSADEFDVPIDGTSIEANSNNPWVPGADDYRQFISDYKTYYAETAPSRDFVSEASLELPEQTTEKGNFSTSEVHIIPENTPQKIERSQKLKIRKKKSLVKDKEENNFGTSEKCVVKEITNSSGCWMVSESPSEKNSSNVKSKKDKKKSSESGGSHNVCEMFKSLEEKISKKLKKKLSEIEETEIENIEDKKIAPKEKVSKKKRKLNRNSSDEQILFDQNLDADSDVNGKINGKNAESSVPSLSCVDIDACKFSVGSTKRLASETPDTIITDGDNIDDDENTEDAYRQMVEEAFASDDVVADFEEEKTQAIDNSLPKIVDSSLPGWGSWTSSKELTEKKTTKTKRPRFNKRLLFKVPKAPPRKDANKGHVIINEEKSNKLKEHMVSDLPYPFTQVKDFEATVRAPIGRTWIPETAHQQLVAPPVVTKLGAVIEPMDEGELIDRGEL